MPSPYLAEGCPCAAVTRKRKKNNEKIFLVYPHEQTAFAALRNRKLQRSVIRNSRGSRGEATAFAAMVIFHFSTLLATKEILTMVSES
jgi:hypothetical protein